MSNNTQLPAEIVEQIKAEAKNKGNNHLFTPLDGDYSSRGFHSFIVERAYEAGATEYATKMLHMKQEYLESDKALQVSRKQRKQSEDDLKEAKKLLAEVFRKHESGLLPDRFVYDKIKKFLYGGE